ncbi:UNVERIFIED_CONTAM: hypothetical protein Slati_2202300 [Sesamum latifolium]|uniref:Integrase catalytic domain-containing protein n=1 Tax=Sesamum latifolium TaxID=2727402 RepID=A0AAW2WVK3_9LAMI
MDEHPDIDRILALLARRYYWSRIEEDVEACVRTCLVCQLDKVEKNKKVGLLQPLPIPKGLWQSVSMDFISNFPKINSMASVLVVVDRFFKDAKFIGRFWTTLFKILGMELKFSTTNHPQTDGQTERVNALLEDYMRHYVSQNQQNWVDLLDVAQFSYNLHKSSITGMSPFELVYRMKKYADMRRRHVEFTVGDQIWKKINSKSVHRGLIPKYDGPFEVMSNVGSLAYRLKLPGRLKIHPTFHRRKELHNPQGRWILSVGMVCKPLRATLGTSAVGMRIRLPNGAGIVRHNDGQSGRQVGRGARLWHARALAERCADGREVVRAGRTCGVLLKDAAHTSGTTVRRLDAACASNTQCAEW